MPLIVYALTNRAVGITNSTKALPEPGSITALVIPAIRLLIYVFPYSLTNNTRDIRSMRAGPCFPEPEVSHRVLKKGKTRSLIERLRKLKDEVCRFVKDFTVPFDNNLAERDLRNIKTKIKVSGCFRTTDGAENYLKIMSYIGTAKKNGINAVKALKAAFDGTPDIIFGR